MKNIPLISRDLSWLSFNERVLQEAGDKRVPLLERLRFLGIFSNNRDEFFRVRVATIRRLSKWPNKANTLLGLQPDQLLDKIQKITIYQQTKFDFIYESVIKELKKEKILFVNETKITSEEKVYLKKYYQENISPFIFPILVDSVLKFPYLKDKSTYLIVKILTTSKVNNTKLALIEIPTDNVSRFVTLPSVKNQHRVILLDDVIRLSLPDIFSIMYIKKIEAFAIKLTRDAELDIDSDISKSWVEKISKSVKMRKRGHPVRLVYDKKMPIELLKFILKKMKLQNTEYAIPGGRYHNFKDFINFPRIGSQKLRYQIPQPKEHPLLKNQRSIFSVLRKRDILLSYPYQSFHHLIDLLREASIDPDVLSIKITLYRAANHSSIINALINALKNGKEVTVVVELQARFDEEANIQYANSLQEEGAKVIFGVPGLKVHSKLFLITRKENNRIQRYAHIGTGNFNEHTSKVYCDHSILTSDIRITSEVENLFKFYDNNFKIGNYEHLIVAPFTMRKKFVQLIDHEIKNAKNGKPAFMILKMNSLHDQAMIKKLYDASQAGVQIRMIVRGICSLVTELKGYSDNIQVISIVDKFLEHSRIFVFANGGKEKYFISSGDWMYRNLDHRSEVAVPIYDNQIKLQLKQYLEFQLMDNYKGRIINREQNNVFVTSGKKLFRSQELIYKYQV